MLLITFMSFGYNLFMFGSQFIFYRIKFELDLLLLS
jgi:hypothetical protein